MLSFEVGYFAILAPLGLPFLVPRFLSYVVVSSVRKYHATNQEKYLAPSIWVLQQISRELHGWGLAVSRIKVKGWATRVGSVRFDVASLSQANPGFKIRIRRELRRDLIDQRKSLGMLAGFTLTAKSKSGFRVSRKLDFFISLAHGAKTGLPFSNPRAKFLSHSSLLQRVASSQSGVGFIDEINIKRRPNNLVSWLSPYWRVLDYLVINKAWELMEFARSNVGGFALLPIAQTLRDLGLEEDAEKFEFLAGFGESSFRSHQLVTVNRHFVPEISREFAQAKMIEMVEFEKGVFCASLGTGELLSPPPGWITLEKVEIVGGSILISEKTLHCFEYASDPQWDFVSGLWHLQFGSEKRTGSALVKNVEAAQKGLGEVILIGGRNDRNYYHFMIEYLPRVLRIPAHIPPEVPLVLSRYVPDSGLEALKALSNRQVIRIDPDVSYAAQVVHVSSPVTQVLDTSKVPWSDGLFMNTPHLHAFREACMSRVDTSEVHGKNVFLLRSSGHRSVKNENKLSRIARREGMAIVDITKLSWTNQVNLFRNADLIVGAGGAIMANYLFAKKGASIIALVSRRSSTFTLPAQIASVAGANFKYFVGNPVDKRWGFSIFQHWVHADFVINPKKFRKLLRREMTELKSMKKSD